MKRMKTQNVKGEISVYTQRAKGTGLEYRTSEDWSEKKNVRALRLLGVFDLKGVILDLGCGTGVFTHYLIRAFEKVIGLDVAYTNLIIAKELDKKSNYICGSGLNLPFKDYSFDAVLCARVLHHFPDITEPLKEIHRVLKKDGILFTMDPNDWNLVSSMHYRKRKFSRCNNYHRDHHALGYLYMKRKLRLEGFKVLRKHGLTFAPSKANGIWRFAKILEPYLESLPLVNMFGGSLLMTAKAMKTDPMHKSMKLLRTIGSPFTPEQKQALPENRSEAQELYVYATKNKIGLLYLEALKNQEKLKEFGLVSEYQEERKKHNEQVTTAVRVSKLFNSANINYVVFKSIMPYPAVPNDVDIVHLGSDAEYKKTVEIMLQSGYEEFFGEFRDRSPSQLMFHDSRDGPHLGLSKKDIYDIDLYREIKASYIIYLDREKFVKYVTEMNVLDVQIKVLEPEAELVALIIHSIIPEQLCTFSVYYSTLYYLAKMNSKNIDRFVYIAKENNVTFPVRTHCSLIAELHKAVHGFVPKALEAILAKLGDETKEIKNLINADFEMPYKYSWSTVIRTLFEKGKEGEFRRSVVKQMIHMLSPTFAKSVIQTIIMYRKRKTY